MFGFLKRKNKPKFLKEPKNIKLLEAKEVIEKEITPGGVWIDFKDFARKAKNKTVYIDTKNISLEIDDDGVPIKTSLMNVIAERTGDYSCIVKFVADGGTLYLRMEPFETPKRRWFPW